MSDLGEARWGIMVTQKCMHDSTWFFSTHYFLFKQRTLLCSCSSESCFVFVPPYIHTHTHTHTVIFSLKKRKSHSCTQAFEEWCLGKTTRETEHVPCVFAQCMHVWLSCVQLHNRKDFFKKSNSRDFSDGPVIKRLSLLMKGCRDQSLVRECHMPWGQKPKT